MQSKHILLVAVTFLGLIAFKYFTAIYAIPVFEEPFVEPKYNIHLTKKNNLVSSNFISRRWTIVQSDNRNKYMQQASFSSLHRYAAWANASHKIYKCSARGWKKPALIEAECAQQKYILWIDSDVVVQTPLNLSKIEKLMAPDVALLAGIDFKTTTRSVYLKKSMYVDFFNDGIFAVNCENAKELLNQWKTYAFSVNEGDQIPLQHMARSNSVFSDKIAYEFQLFGAYSKHFKHYPGNYRNGFPKNILLQTDLFKKLDCFLRSI